MRDRKNCKESPISSFKGRAWRSLAIGLTVFLVHSALAFAVCGQEFSKSLRSVDSLIKQASFAVFCSRAHLKYSNPNGAVHAVIQSDTLCDIELDSAAVFMENLCDHRAVYEWNYHPFDSPENLIRYVCDRANRRIGTWILNPFTDCLSEILFALQSPVLNPYYLFTDRSAQYPGQSVVFAGVNCRIALDLMFGLVAFRTILTALRAAITPRGNRKWKSICRSMLVLPVILFGPLLFRLAIGMSEGYPLMNAGLRANSYGSDYLCSLFKNGCTLWSFSMFQGDLFPGSIFWYSAHGALLYLLCNVASAFVCFIIVAQFTYLLLLTAARSIILTFHLVLAPIFFACFAQEKTKKFFWGYLAMWGELMAWLLLSAIQFRLLNFVIYSGLDMLPRFWLAFAVLQLMFFSPQLISTFNIGPSSKFLKMDLIEGTVCGVHELARTLREIYNSFYRTE